MSSSKQTTKEGSSEVGPFALVRQDIAIRKILQEGKEEIAFFKVDCRKHTIFAPEVTQVHK